MKRLLAPRSLFMLRGLHALAAFFSALFIYVCPLASSAHAELVAGIAPHHAAASAMIERFYAEARAASGGGVRRVWLFAPDHYRSLCRPASVCPSDIGPYRVDAEAARELGKSRYFEARADSYSREHGITVHLPYIADTFPGALVIPILLRSRIDDVALISIANRISGMMREGDLILLSMDLSHYKDPEGLAREDERTIEVLTKMAAIRTKDLDIDASRAASLLLQIARRKGVARGRLLERSDTSEMTGSRVPSGTGYATILYESEGSLKQ